MKSAEAMSVKEFQDSKTNRAKTRLMRAAKQVNIKVEMLNFRFNTTLDYIYEFILKSYQSGTKTLSRSDAETVLNFPYGSGNPLLGFALRSQNFACGALPPVGFFCSLTGLVSLRPSANPLHSVKTF